MRTKRAFKINKKHFSSFFHHHYYNWRKWFFLFERWESDFNSAKDLHQIAKYQIYVAESLNSRLLPESITLLQASSCLTEKLNSQLQHYQDYYAIYKLNLTSIMLTQHDILTNLKTKTQTKQNKAFVFPSCVRSHAYYKAFENLNWWPIYSITA